jgi:HSP20 family protein
MNNWLKIHSTNGLGDTSVDSGNFVLKTGTNSDYYYQPVVTLLEDFDLLFKDLFDSSSFFATIPSIKKIDYPVDIKESKTGLEIDVAAVGLSKEDIKIEIDNNVLKIIYVKQETDKKNESNYLFQGITRKSFSHAWKISDKFDLSKIDANLEKGLLKILIPIAPEKQPKQIEVKIK